MRLANLLVLLSLCSVLALAQSTDATVSGTITDPTGAAIVNATVLATNTATGVVTQTSTNEAGVYTFQALTLGTYRFTAEHGGFRKAVVNNVTLEVGGKITLNMPLELGQTTDSVEVQATAAEVNTSNANVGSVVTGRKILELPLAGRSTYDLLTTQAGVYGANVSGNRTGSLNVTTDGINAQDNLLNGLFNIGVANQIRVDRVEEFRIVVSSTDVELGRGSGQIQVVTRAGNNAFHGSVFEEHRNTALNANTWFNNQLGTDLITGQAVAPRDILIRNQYGGRLGGPIRKNKTFFNGYYEGEKQRQKNSTNTTVLTPTARQGIFRFFPGVQNTNAGALIPTVDLQGNPVKPATATGDLQSVSIFGRDPNRLVADPTGIVAQTLTLLPLPNNYRAGDGLNTAGFSWARPVVVNFATYEVRVDHNFNSSHRMSTSYSHQAYDSLNVAGPQPLPLSPGGRAPTETTQYVASFTSVLRPNLLNEFRAGVFRPRTEIVAPYDPAAGFKDVLPRINGVPVLTDFATFTDPVTPQNFGGDNSNRLSPVYQYGDNISWLKGRHSFKGGVEIRLVSSAGYDAFAVTSRAVLGAGGPAVTGITTIPLIGQNSGGASALLTDLSGSVSATFQAFNSPGGPNPVYLAGQTRYRNYSQHEYSAYFKDEFKIRPNLTLNMGIRYEWYAVPNERQQKALAIVGSDRGLFGISGTGFGDLFQPGRLNGALSVIQPVGPGTVNPDTKLYNNDNNNFAPGLGLAWSPAWLGKNKTVVRAGYGISYERNPIYLTHDVAGLQPGYSETPIYTQAALMTLANARIPPPTSGPPLTQIPLTQRTATIRAFDQNLRNPYIQNFNFSITRSLPGNSWLDVRYVGTQASKLVRKTNINEVNTIENGILDAYKITQAGGNAPLFDRMFIGLPGVPAGITGSDFVRSFTTTNAFLVNNNVAGLASYISSTTNFGAAGTILRRVGLAENFVVVNPQVAYALLVSNLDNSTYHSMQLEFTKRSNSFILQSNYTWSRSLGSYDGEDSSLDSNFRTLRNRSLDKKLLGYHRAHIVRTNGIYELPFGPGKLIGRNSSGILGKVIGGFQTGFIFNVFSGPPLSFGAVNAFNSAGGATPVIVGKQPSGGVTMTGNGPVYFTGLQQVVDPYVSSITTLQGLQARSTMKAIADSSGKLLLVNPSPGQFGTLGLTSITGPGAFRLDVNLLKKIRVTERIELTLRADAINLTNTPNWGNPSLDINSTNFGRITGTSGNSGSPSNRLVVLQGRITF
jgi:hypothetical protein